MFPKKEKKKRMHMDRRCFYRANYNRKEAGREELG
jgi:hypothetical protein